MANEIRHKYTQTHTHTHTHTDTHIHTYIHTYIQTLPSHVDYYETCLSKYEPEQTYLEKGCQLNLVKK